MNQSLWVVTLFIAESLAMTVPAFAHNDGTGGAMARYTASTAANTLTVKGNLSCDMGAVNNGETCTLKIRDNQTGKVWDIANAGAVLKLYRDGVKQVAIQGSTSSDTIAVIRVDRL